MGVGLGRSEDNAQIPAPTRSSRGGLLHDRALLAIVGVALVVRVALASQMTVLHADEVWQYLEPAYGLITGSWVRAWEFHAGIRGWFVPVLLIPPLALGHAIAPESQLHIYLMRAMLSVISLGIPIAWYDLARPFGRRHALIAAWVAAIWCEVFYFGVRPSSEALGMALLFPAMALAQRLRHDPGPRKALALGLLLALGFVVRFHYLPAIGLIAIWGLGRSWQRVMPALALGFSAGIAIGGLCDLITGHAPLVWIWRSIAFNVVTGGSSMFGTQPPWWFATYQIETWGWASLAIIPLILLGAWRLPMLLLIAAAVYAPHSLIAHKEYRFVILGTTTLILLAVIGSVELCALLRRRWPDERITLAALGLGWSALSLTVALSPVFIEYWTQGDEAFSTLVIAGEQPGLCGIALYEQPNHPALAMSLFNRNVPALLFDGPEAPDEARAMVDRYNVAIASQLHGAALPRGFHLVTCWHQQKFPIEDRQQCLFVRSGGCHGSAGDFSYQPAMERRGK
ncbi:mannosyltransferase [Novosphingobium sp. Fuku2-ISO-50]|uniref:mannosyltransferase n=1 Tax=Novosphingobium sp. Fuku2-ISO-50 TaxID=1739114 RepID=UPI00076C547B|nr:mannosyltransferase [Novosphingobium sp. Fuku2-ISO-50]KUR76265.1 mannosyltransferase [Novosphingobium sp. Fuku2-ISO-50]